VAQCTWGIQRPKVVASCQYFAVACESHSAIREKTTDDNAAWLCHGEILLSFAQGGYRSTRCGQAESSLQAKHQFGRRQSRPQDSHHRCCHPSDPTPPPSPGPQGDNEIDGRVTTPLGRPALAAPAAHLGSPAAWLPYSSRPQSWTGRARCPPGPFSVACLIGPGCLPFLRGPPPKNRVPIFRLGEPVFFSLRGLASAKCVRRWQFLYETCNPGDKEWGRGGF
jgi:hypothetical protein